MAESALALAIIAVALVGYALYERLRWLADHERLAAHDREELIGALRESQRSTVELAGEIMDRLGYQSTGSDAPQAESVSEDDEIAAARREAVERVDAELAMMAEKMQG